MISVKKLFTLLELLIVISVIMILITILLPALKSAKEKAKEIVCCSNLKQLGNTVFFYADDSGDYLPDSRWGGNGDRGGGGIYSLSGYSAYDSTYKGYWWTQQLRWYLKNDVKIFHCQSPPIDASYPPASGGGDISYVYNGVLAYTDGTGDYPGVSPISANQS